VLADFWSSAGEFHVECWQISGGASCRIDWENPSTLDLKKLNTQREKFHST
jgi:hypothetical protein